MNPIRMDAMPAQPFDYSSLLLFGCFIVIFYFFVIRPQKKKQAQQRDYIQQLKKGDKVVTIGGLHATIFEVDGDKVILEVDEHGRKLTYAKNAISVDNANKTNEKK